MIRSKITANGSLAMFSFYCVIRNHSMVIYNSTKIQSENNHIGLRYELFTDKGIYIVFVTGGFELQSLFESLYIQRKQYYNFL